MYAKVFKSMFQGTLRGKSDAILVFVNLLTHCDKNGFVDQYFQAISDETGLPLQRVVDAVTLLESPDSQSRSPELEGRRLARVDAHRAWGWQVVNYAHYREIWNEETKREANRLRQEKFRKAHSKTQPIPTANGDQASEQPAPARSITPKPRPVEKLTDISSFPQPLQTTEFGVAWEGWKKHRVEKKKPLTPSTTEKQLKMLAEWGSHRAVAALNWSIQNGWQGIFEPSPGQVPSAPAGSFDATSDQRQPGESQEQYEKRLIQLTQ